MIKRITPEEVVEMNRLYKQHGSYAEVARIIGRSASSVAKYIKLSTTPSPVKTIIHNV